MFRSSRLWLRSCGLHYNRIFQNDCKINFKRCTQDGRVRCQSTQAHGPKTSHSQAIRNGGMITLFVIGTLVSAKLWLVNSDCQAAEKDERKEKKKERKRKQRLKDAINKSNDLLERVKDETGSPGVVIAVSVDGQMIWSTGLGYSDVENRVACTPDTVMRIASISKPITATIIGRLMEDNLLDVDKPVQEYVPDFPLKTVDGEKVTMTTRQVLSHTSGIRSYNKDYMKKGNQEKAGASKDTEEKKPSEAWKVSEMLIKKHYNSVKESLGLFKDDPLVHKPGSKFLYSSHGFTLVSAVIEGAAKKPIKELYTALFRDLGLQYTYLDEHSPLIYHRSRYYVKSSKGRVINAPYVDTSYKWAGGGLLSNVGDLVKYGNIMLYSMQWKPPLPTEPVVTDSALAAIESDSQSNLTDSSNHTKPKKQTGHSKSDYVDKNISGQIEKSCETKERVDTSLKGYLKPDTIKKLWSICENTDNSIDRDAGYSLGWSVLPESREHGFCRDQEEVIYHTGGAIGASSVLLIIPRSKGHNSSDKGDNPPKGIVIAVMSNMISVGLRNTALKIAEEFSKAL